MSGIDNDDLRIPEPGGGWISGRPRPAVIALGDTRPEFDPTILLYGVLGVLRERGVYVAPTDSQWSVAEIACAHVLRAVGVRPAR